MKINWSLMNRFGFCEEEDEFSGFQPGARTETSVGVKGDNDTDDDDDDDFIDDDDDDEPELPAGSKEKKPTRQQPTLDQDSLVRQIAEVTAASLRQGQQQGQPLTEAQIQERLGRPQVTADLIARLRNPEVTAEEVAGLLQQLQDGTYKYAMTTTQHLLQHQLAPLLEMQAQFAQQQREQKEAAFRSSLVNHYPTLKKFNGAVGRAMQELSSEGFSAKGMNPEQVYKAVAQRAKKIIRESMPDFSLKQKPSGQFRQAGSFRTSRQGQGNPASSQASGAASFTHILT